jgi:glutamyl-tRNA reductase
MLIEINRYTIKKLEEAIEKYNQENKYRVMEYSDIIEKLCEDFVKTALHD